MQNNLNKQQTIYNILYNYCLIKDKIEEQEKQVMLDLWNISTKGKQIILKRKI